MKLNKWLAITLSMLCLCLLATPLLSCKKSDKVVIEMALADSFNSWLAAYAIRGGIVTSPDVDLRITLAATSTYETILMAGKYDMGALSISRLASVPQSGTNLMAISTFVTHAGALEHKGVNFVLTRANSTISSPSDLKGKEVAVFNMTDTTAVFVALLKQDYGIDAKEKQNITDAENQVALVPVQGDLAEFVKNGTYEAALIAKNDGPKASKDPALKVLMNLDEVFYDMYGVSYVASTLVVKRDFQKNNPVAVEAAYKLLIESLAYGKSHLDELASLYGEEYATGQNADFYKTIYNEHSGIILTEIKGDAKTVIMTEIGFCMVTGEITTMPDPDYIFGSPYVK
jgi:ABC-type nitrate/sulfonate/bicarbonate transport system substrate-binding protein